MPTSNYFRLQFVSRGTRPFHYGTVTEYICAHSTKAKRGFKCDARVWVTRSKTTKRILVEKAFANDDHQQVIYTSFVMTFLNSQPKTLSMSENEPTAHRRSKETRPYSSISSSKCLRDCCEIRWWKTEWWTGRATQRSSVGKQQQRKSSGESWF